MTLFNLMFDALKGLVANRVHEDNFPQVAAVLQVPAIRISLISGEVFADVCGNDLTTGNPQYQVDIVDATPQARNALLPLVCAAIDALSPPAVLQGLPRNSFDAETKTYRASLDYVFNPSSPT